MADILPDAREVVRAVLTAMREPSDEALLYDFKDEHDWRAVAASTKASRLTILRGILDHLLAPEGGGRMSDWQPIETAPKDGAQILISDGEDIWMAEWVDYAPPTGFIECGSDAGGLSVDQLAVCTHWMPLPAPPVLAPEEVG